MIPPWVGPALSEAVQLIGAIARAGITDVPAEVRRIRQSYEQRRDAGIEPAWQAHQDERFGPPDTEPGGPARHETQPSMPAVTGDGSEVYGPGGRGDRS